MEKAIGQASGKIILSGEYAVVFGYPGIAVPCSCLGHTTGAVPAPFTVTATWEGSPSPGYGNRDCRSLPSPPGRGKYGNLSLMYSGIENEDYLHHILEEIQKYTGPCLSGRQALSGHLTIENTIPIGRGMGSSTALVVAVTRCLLETCHPEPDEGRHADIMVRRAHHDTLKKITLSIEDAVNPGHSGLDFEVIWENVPILFQKEKAPYKLPTTHYKLDNAVLIDTGKPNETTPEMVAWVKKNSLSPRERVRVRGALQTIAHCTERLLKGKDLKKIFKAHHRAQVALGVVPKPVQSLIAEIEASGGAAKIIGAGSKSGGGGIVLALAKNASTLAASYGYRCFNSQHRLHKILGQ